ncbi:hypothetical protein BCR32DRAFT_205283, partial [Anaeromyces robustus]
MKYLLIVSFIFGILTSKIYAEKCWSEKIGYKCCSSPNAVLQLTDIFGYWSVEDGEWCFIRRRCFSEKLGFPCCSDPSTVVVFVDESSEWGVENDGWCGF